MTVKEAEQVNASFKNLKDSINIYRESLFATEREFSAYTGRSLSLVNQHLQDKKYYAAKYDSIYTLYKANVKIYEKRENDFRRERQAQQLLVLIVGVISVILAYK